MKKNANITDEKCFWVCSGSILRNLEDLKNCLWQMEKDSFKYHVNKEKNDFAIWVKEVLEDNTLANKLSKTKTAKKMIKAIEDSLAE